MRHVKGDITETELSIIAQCVNCHAKMGSGVALAIRKKWPDIYSQYAEICHEQKDNPSYLLGGVMPFYTDDKKLILNIFGQINYGYDGQKYANYSAIITAIANCYNHVFEKGSVIAIPKIGSDRGGLKWEIMEMLLREMEEFLEIEFVVYSI